MIDGVLVGVTVGVTVLVGVTVGVTVVVGVTVEVFVGVGVGVGYVNDKTLESTLFPPIVHI